MAEQGHICCYCECRVFDSNSHIEHFQPQSAPGVDPLDYANLLCSCQNHLKRGEPRHCGNLKGDWFDAERLLSPLDSDCEGRFRFYLNGTISPRADDDQAALETIKKLGLNIPKLKAMRDEAIEPFLDENLSESDLQKFVSGYLRKNGAGKFGELWTTIYYLFGDYVALGTTGNEKFELGNNKFDKKLPPVAR